MKYKDFLENLADDLQEEFEKRNKYINIKVVEMSKPEGMRLGLQINDGRNINPIFYPKEFYEAHETGAPYFPQVYQLADSILEELASLPQTVKFDLKELINTISIQVVSTELSKDYLKGKVHREIEDLAIVYRLQVDDIDKNGSVVITEEQLKLLEMTEQDLYQTAMEKAPINVPCEIMSMHAMMEELEPDMAMIMPESPLMIVTNESRYMGAGTLFYPETLERCANAMNGDYFIIPSSQHECLLYPDNDAVSLHELENIVREVNDTLLAPEELLSYNVYHYDSKEKVFEIADKYYERMETKERRSVMESLQDKKKEVAESSRLRRNQDLGSRKIHEASL